MKTLSEGIQPQIINYTKVNNIIHEILCSKGSCSLM